MPAVVAVSILAVAAVIVLAWRQPWRAVGRRPLSAADMRLMALMLVYGYQSRHGAREPEPEPDRMAEWPGEIVGVHVCAQCAAPMGDAPACPRCGWTMPPGRAPWDRPAAMILLPMEGSDISGPGGPLRPPEPPAGGGQPVIAAGRPGPGPGAWRGAYDALAPDALAGKADPPEPPACAPRPVCLLDGKPRYPLPWPPPPGPDLAAGFVYGSAPWGPVEPPPPEPELPPSGDWAPGTGPPDDGEGEGGGWTLGAMRWAPSRLATPADADHAAELARQDADAAEYIDGLDRWRRATLWELRRALLAQRGEAYA